MGEKRSIRVGVIFTMTSSFQKGSKNISFEKGGLQRKHKFKNRNFKSNKTSFGSKPKRLLSLKLHTSFKKLGLKDSTLEKKGRNLKKFNLVSNTRNSRFEDSFGFMKLSVLEGRLPAKFKNSVSKIYKIKERIFDPISGEETNSFAGLKNLILEESKRQERLSVFLEKGFTRKKSKILGESSNLDKVLLRPSSFIDNNQEEGLNKTLSRFEDSPKILDFFRVNPFSKKTESLSCLLDSSNIRFFNPAKLLVSSPEMGSKILSFILYILDTEFLNLAGSLPSNTESFIKPKESSNLEFLVLETRLNFLRFLPFFSRVESLSPNFLKLV